jgi:hypothetical protein
VRNYLNAHYILIADIDLSYFSSDGGWDPIGTEDEPFTGTFDGIDKVIKNLTISRGTIDFIGLFGVIGSNAEIINVSLENVNVIGNYYVGALVGKNDGGTIKDSYATGNVSGKDRVGGLVGFNSGGTIKESYATVSVAGSSTSGTNVGGLVGMNNGTIEKSSATGQVNGNNSVGGLVGANSGTITGSNYDRDTTGRSDTGKGIPKTTAEMKQLNTFEGWDFENVWYIHDGKDYPRLRWELDSWPDHSGFTVDIADQDTIIAGVEFKLSITEAKGIFGNVLNGEINVTVSSNTVVGEVYKGMTTFDEGNATVEIRLDIVGEHALDIYVEGITSTQQIQVEVIALLDSIAVTKLPEKTEYFVGEDLDLTGLVVTGIYSDGSQVELTITVAHISGFDSRFPADEQEVTVTYEGKSDTFTVRIVEPVLESITVTKYPDKTEYFVGEVLDLAGLEVTAYYSDKSEKELDIDRLTISGFDSRFPADKQEVTVTYEGKSDTFTVDIVEPVLESIEITSKPTKTTYFVGEDLDLTGLVVTGIYSDGSQVELTITMAHISGFNSSAAATNQEVTVDYNGKTATFTVTILAEPDEEAPSVPANLRSTCKTTTGISLAWDEAIDNVGVAYYELEMKQGSGSWEQVATPSGTTYTKTDLIPSTIYTFRVRAVDEAGNQSAWSAELSVSTDSGSGGGDGGSDGGGDGDGDNDGGSGGSGGSDDSDSGPGGGYSDDDDESGDSGGGSGRGRRDDSTDQAPPNTDPVETAGDELLVKALREEGQARVNLADLAEPNVALSVAVIGQLVQENRTLTVENTGLALQFPPGALNTEQVATLDQKAAIQIGSREIAGEEKQAIRGGLLAGETGSLMVVVGPLFDLSVRALTPGEAGEQEAAPITGFKEPVTVTVSLAHLGQLTQAQIDRLTGVRLEVDPEGNLTIVELGGTYDEEAKTFSFTTDRFSLYTIMMAGEEISITLTLGHHLAVVNDVTYELDAAPFLKAGVNRTMVPLRLIGQVLGAQVDWLEETQQVVIRDIRGQRQVEVILTIGSDRAMIDGDPVDLDCPAELLIPPGRTFVPLRFVSEALGARVDWDDAAQSITITRRQAELIAE